MIVIYPEHWQTLNIHAEKTYPEECCGLLLGKINRLLAEVGNSESELRKSASKKHFCKRFNQQVKIVTQVWPTPNSWNGEAANDFSQITGLETRTNKKHRNFTIAPQDMLKAQKYAAENQLVIVGIYHSHPDYPAIPSEFDRAIAWQQYSYLIISVIEGKATNRRSWVLNDQHQFEEEEISS